MVSESTDSPSVTVYTDGACKPNPGPGGWGYVVYDGQTPIGAAFGGAPDTTSNRMELAAAAEALNALTERCKVVVYTDSQYLRNGITTWLARWKRNGWVTSGQRGKRGDPVKNVDLWMWLWHLISKHDVTWQWVRGHVGVAGNDYADQLACQGAAATRDAMAPAGPVVVTRTVLVDPDRPAISQALEP